MPMPERLRAWCEEDAINLKIVRALMEGAIAGSQGASIADRAPVLGFTARSAEGDAFEAGWEFGLSASAAAARMPIVTTRSLPDDVLAVFFAGPDLTACRPEQIVILRKGEPRP